jgi:hypothetical protein
MNEYYIYNYRDWHYRRVKCNIFFLIKFTNVVLIYIALYAVNISRII